MFYKVLAFDGGGLRSIYSAQLLFRLHDRFKILNGVDMIAGVSGGAIVAAALSCGWSPSQITDFFAADGPEIFERCRFPGVVDNLAYMRKSKYGPGRTNFFRKYFGDKKLSDARTAVVIPAFDVRHKSGLWQPVAYTNFPNSPLRDSSFVEAVTASSAAPIYFPVYPAPSSKMVDGGIWANNPSEAALSEALRMDHGGAQWNRVVVLSIGTTIGRQTLDTPKNNLGLLDWFENGVLDLLTDAAAKLSVDYKMRNFIGPRYHRMDTMLDDHIDLDDIDSIPDLVRLANEYDLDQVEQWLQGFWL